MQDNENVELRLVKQQRVKLLEERRKLRAGNGLAFYRPHTKQASFHRAGQCKFRMVRAGNRFGKSEMGCAEDVAQLIGERTWFPQGDPDRTRGLRSGPQKGLVVTTNWDKVDEIFTSQRGGTRQQGKLWKYLPPSLLKGVRRNHVGAIAEVELRNGSLLRFDTVQSYKHDPQKSESSDWDFIHIDEPCPEDMFKAASRGLMDRNGVAYFTLTPLTEFWINDFFFPREARTADAGLYLQNNRWALNGSTYDNPFLSKDAIAEFEATLTEDEKQCRLHGIPLELSGLVYKEFQYDTHVLRSLPAGWLAYNCPPRNYTIYYAIDPHPQTPHAVLFLAVSPLGQVFLYDEIFLHTNIRTLAEIINAKVNGYFVAHAKVDPLAYINDPITDSNMAEEFAKYGVFLEKATKAKAHGILNLQGCLARPGYMYVTPNCKETIREFQRYCYDKENKPIDKDDHMMENLYRLMLDDPQYIDASAPSKPVRDVEITYHNFDQDEGY